MGTMKNEVGFTIIETMMFLAITGILAIGILAGTGAAIAQQRYKDSVNSLQSFVQDQYSKVTNVTNSRDNSWGCNAGVVREGGGEPRGTDECVILGRMIRVDAAGRSLTASDVVGQRRDGVVTRSSDTAELAENYIISTSPVDVEVDDVAWGSTIVRPKTTNPQQTSIMIIRSPLTGRILTFAATAHRTPAELVGVGLASSPTLLCLEPAESTVGATRLGVRIGAYAASQSAVQVAPESDGLCA